MSDICEQFEGLLWHDSKLLELSFYRSGAEERVRIRVSLRQPSLDPKVVDVVFLQSTYLEASVDLEGKRVCSDDISSASCHSSSDWIDRLARDHPHDSFGGYFHFRIRLVPPGGLINVLAKVFTLEPVAS